MIAKSRSSYAAQLRHFLRRHLLPSPNENEDYTDGRIRIGASSPQFGYRTVVCVANVAQSVKLNTVRCVCAAIPQLILPLPPCNFISI